MEELLEIWRLVGDLFPKGCESQSWQNLISNVNAEFQRRASEEIRLAQKMPLLDLYHHIIAGDLSRNARTAYVERMDNLIKNALQYFHDHENEIIKLIPHSKDAIGLAKNPSKELLRAHKLIWEL